MVHDMVNLTPIFIPLKKERYSGWPERSSIRPPSIDVISSCIKAVGFNCVLVPDRPSRWTVPVRQWRLRQSCLLSPSAMDQIRTAD